VLPFLRRLFERQLHRIRHYVCHLLDQLVVMMVDIVEIVLLGLRMQHSGLVEQWVRWWDKTVLDFYSRVNGLWPVSHVE
jgi:hypothetical protein